MAALAPVSRLRLAATAVLAFGVACRPPAPRAELSDAAAAAVRDTLIALDGAMNAAIDSLDCARGLAYIGDDQPLFVSSGRVIATHEALLGMCGAMVAPRTGATFVASGVAAHALAPDAGYVVKEGEYTIRFKDGRTRTHHLVMTTIWARRSGTWRMVHLHESAPPPS